MSVETKSTAHYSCDWCGAKGTAVMDPGHLDPCQALPPGWSHSVQHVAQEIHPGGLTTCSANCRAEYFGAQDRAIVAARESLEAERKAWRRSQETKGKRG